MIYHPSRIEDRTFKTYSATMDKAGNLLSVRDVDYISRDLAGVKVSGLQQDRSPDKFCKKNRGIQESILRDELATLETTLEDIQLSSESSSI
ncbi:hypothetical protein Tco_1067924 [Tanacetum coccineum]|uniref:Uncharacterized protein n=1 Tax=Tanacetum coccineum TaxID=301880 RepID=A0ABQ5HEB1_9ASTR